MELLIENLHVIIILLSWQDKVGLNLKKKKSKHNLLDNKKSKLETFDRKKNVSEELLLIYKRTKPLIA